VCVVHLTLSEYLDLTCSTSVRRAVFDRWEEAGLTEEQEMEATPAVRTEVDKLDDMSLQGVSSP
jgi:hypothetical protein